MALAQAAAHSAAPVQIAIPLSGGRCYQRLALSPSGGVVAASYDGIVHLIDSVSGELMDSIDAHDGYISMMAWSPKPLAVPGLSDPLSVLCTCGTDKRVRLWRSPK